MELWFALKVTQSHFYHILLIVSHKILPQFKRHGQRPSHVIGTCRMRDNGRDTALENMPPLLSGSSLSFTTVVPSLLNCGFTPSSVSLVWGPLCGRELWLGHIQKFTAAWLLRTVQALPWALTLPGFGLGSFSHCLGTMVIWVFPFLRSSLCFLPHRRWYCPSWWFLLISSDFVVCELHSLLVLCECCLKGFDLALYSSYSVLLLCGDLGRSKIVLPLPPPFYQHLLRIIF